MGKKQQAIFNASRVSLIGQQRIFYRIDDENFGAEDLGPDSRTWTVRELISMRGTIPLDQDWFKREAE